MITPADEQLHPPADDPAWQESFYFNWADPAGRSFGLTRIGYNPPERKMDGILVTMRDGRLEYIYPGVGLPFDPTTAPNPEAGLTTGALTFTMREPLTRWHVSLSGRNEVDLSWTATAPPYDFHGGQGALGAEHFEQSGTMTGRLRLRGQEYTIDGVAHRDKSWGARDWAAIDGWEWLTAHFGADFGFNFTETHLAGRDTIAGFVQRDGVNRPICDGRVAYTWTRTADVPATARITLTDGEGERYDIRATALAQVPLYKKGLFIQETHARFETVVDGTRRHGVGVLEHAWHADTRRLLRRLPDLGGALVTAAREKLR